MSLQAYVRALRFDRWPRSLSILVGTSAGWVLYPDSHEQAPWYRFFIALGATFAIALFNYSINEITDAPFDRFHPMKKNRPMASGQINSRVLLSIGIILLATGLATGYIISRSTLVSLAVFAAAGILYNIPPVRMKDVPYLDAAVESFNNPIRFSIGWFTVVSNSSPPWYLVLAWWAFGAFLMYAKRLSEKRSLMPEQAQLYRRSLAQYSHNILIVMVWFSACMTLLFLSAFALTSQHLKVFLTFPIFAVYFTWIFFETLNRSGHVEEPEALFRRPIFLALTLGLGMALFWALGWFS